MSHRILVQPRGLAFQVEPGETILQAALRQRFSLPHSCDNGVCEVCSARLLAGHCRLRPGGTGVAASDNGASNLLICLAEPLADCILESHSILAPGELPLRRIACQIQQIDSLSADVHRVRLLAPAGKKLEFYAGQYVQLLVPGLDGAFFSIANAPGSRELELHIEAPPERDNATEVMRYLRDNLTVKVALPFGKACVSESLQGPVILIAAGTGFAQIKSITEHLLAQGYSDPIHIYWGTRTLKEMYLQSLPQQWRQDHRNLRFTAVAADNADNEWQGHHIELCEAVANAEHELEKASVFVSGSPTMVYTILDRLVDRGLPAQRFYSDVLEYAPR